MADIKEYIIQPHLPHMPENIQSGSLKARVSWMVAQYRDGFLAISEKIRSDIAPHYPVQIIQVADGYGIRGRNDDFSSIIIKTSDEGILAIRELFPQAVIDHACAACDCPVSRSSPFGGAPHLRIIK